MLEAAAPSADACGLLHLGAHVVPAAASGTRLHWRLERRPEGAAVVRLFRRPLGTCTMPWCIPMMAQRAMHTRTRACRSHMAAMRPQPRTTCWRRWAARTTGACSAAPKVGRSQVSCKRCKCSNLPAGVTVTATACWPQKCPKWLLVDLWHVPLWETVISHVGAQ